MAENEKPTVASEWLTGCAGCHMSLLDIDERIVDIINAVTLWSTPITDLKHPPEEGVTVGILEGGINNSTTEEVAKMMRAKSKILVAWAIVRYSAACRRCATRWASRRRSSARTSSESTVDGQIPTTRTSR
jgi:NAD-reducing hydrogenase small subunit